jgi:hypothetical protein
MDFERKKDIELLNEISNPFEREIKLNNDYSLKTIKNHKFEDGFIIESKLKRGLISLNYKNQIIGLLGFNINNRHLDIIAIQGINQPNFKHPKNWYQLILTPFITSCLKVYQNEKNLSKYVSFGEISSGVLEGRIKEMEGLLKNILEKNNERITLREKRIEHYTKEIKRLKQIQILVKKIRDDYFTKDGKINLNKLKVIDVIKKREKQLKTIERYKKNREIRRNKRK